MADRRKLETVAVHDSNDPEDWNCKSTSAAIVTSTTFVWDEPDKPGLFEYSRIGNPTRSCLQRVMASLEKADHAFAVNSGTTAVAVLIQTLLTAGDSIVLPHDVYYGTKISFTDVIKQHGISTVLAESTDMSSIEAAITDTTKIVWIDCPSNPLLRVMDLKKLSQMVHKKNCLLVVDGTFMTPYFQQPLAHGVDVVIHSGTKFLCGHGDVLIGFIATNNKHIASSITDLLAVTGTVPSPFDCYLMIRSIKTLHVRMREHQSNALAVARYLEASPFVEEVIYPGICNVVDFNVIGLASHPDHELVTSQCTGYGGMVSFKIKGGLEGGRRFIKALKVFTCAVSLGSLESLADLCAVMTRKSMPKKDMLEAGIPDNLIRLSVGLEDIQDIIDDMDQAFMAARID